MSINRYAYEAIKAVVGEKNITDDPVDCMGYRSGPGGYESGTGYERVMTRLPGAVCMPRTTKDIQEIVKICGRYDLAFVPYSTGFYGPRSHPHLDDELIIDMKRMRDFEIDAEHFFITVQPGVIYSQIQQECFEHGAYVVVGGGGAQTSAVANLLNDGWSPLSFRIGLPQRRILGLEMVMPDGELVKFGSLADGDDPFWGEGIGPDLRGILRGYTGLLGCLGICTKMAIKTLPFQPVVPEMQGVSPSTSLKLPEKRVKWINFTMPSLKSIEDAHIMLGHAEVGGAVTKVPTFWRAIAKASCKEEFWDLWSKETPESVANFFLVRVMIIGFTSEEQFDYDYNVLTDIINELGGKERRTKPSDESWFKNADSAGMWLMTGSYVSVDYVMDSFDQAFKQGENYRDLKDKYTPPLMPDAKDLGWFQSCEMGHLGYYEFLIYWDQREDTNGMDQFYVDSAKMNVKNGAYPALLSSHQPMYLTGPAYGPDYHKWILGLKKIFDPKWLSHPPLPLAHDEFCRRASWMHDIVDWPVPEKFPYPESLQKKMDATHGKL
ncbi:MAG: FAD-binding oxidoreductase [Anaerovoracaceae bacterium]|nr:FAD-binding oxidoreductase [Bacillota bacterium]MDY2671342.1 FAD-binding oxidoreductase [Anaerovoracaceae bacterium]